MQAAHGDGILDDELFEKLVKEWRSRRSTRVNITTYQVEREAQTCTSIKHGWQYYVQVPP